jgi:hypothetical protein
MISARIETLVNEDVIKSARIETLEKQVALLIKDFKTSTSRVDTLEKQLATILKTSDTDVPQEVLVKPKKEKIKKSKDDTSDDEVDVEVKKTKKEPKANKSKKETSSDDEVKKKRGTNGYIVYSKSVRDEVIAKLSVDDEKPKNTEIMKQQAAMWAELSVEEKADWTAKAHEINAKTE